MRDGVNRPGTIARQGRDQAFVELVATVQQCRACVRMEGRTRVLSAANGPTDARVCFIAEAPGRLGGERTGIPLFADQSGRNFGRLLTQAGLDRASVFVTNAVLCNPRDQKGRNAPPTGGEVRTCSPFLATTLTVLQPTFVVTLGSVALRALALIEAHSLTLAKDHGQVVRWFDRWLVPLYHPSPRAQLARSFPEQAGDFRKLGALIRGEIDALQPSVAAPPLPERGGIGGRAGANQRADDSQSDAGDSPRLAQVTGEAVDRDSLGVFGCQPLVAFGGDFHRGEPGLALGPGADEAAKGGGPVPAVS